MIEILEISKNFGHQTALDRLSLHVKKGEFYSLLGPNGAGKTTCINIISGITKASSGSVFIDGLNTNDQAREIKKKIGIVPQEIALYEDLSALENLQFWGKINGVKSHLLPKRIDNILAFLDLSDKKNQKIVSYSGGMKRRINIAAALLHEPEILFMDEPTVGIDPQSRLFIYEIFERLHQEGKTIFYTSHNMEEVERLSDRIGIIDHGELIAEGNIQTLKTKVSMEETLVVKLKNGFPSEKLKTALSGLSQQFIINKESVFVSTQNTTHDLVALLQILEKTHIEIQGIEVKKVNLEMIFLELTGKKLRD